MDKDKSITNPGDISSTLFTLINSKHLPIKNDHDKINDLSHTKFRAMKTSKFFNLILALCLGLSVSSCSLIGGIFKMGMGVGIFISVAVIVLIIVLILRVSKRSN